MTVVIDLPRALRCAEYREELSRELDGFSLTDAALAAADELEARAPVDDLYEALKSALNMPSPIDDLEWQIEARAALAKAEGRET